MNYRDEKNIYTYYKDFSGDLIDCVYSAIPFTIRKIFSKKWGNYLKENNKAVLTESEELLFQKSALQFENYLLIAEILKQKGCSFYQIKNYFIHKFELPVNYQNSNVKTYHSISNILQTYEVTVAEINAILNTLPKIQKSCFIGYYKKKLDIYKIADKLRCSNDEVVKCLNAVNHALEAYQTGKLLENRDITMIENITIPIPEKKNPEIVPIQKKVIPEDHKKANSVSATLKDTKDNLNSTDIPKIYSGKEEFLSQFNMTEEQLQEILDDFSTDLKIVFTYINGIDRPKYSIDQVAGILKCEKKQYIVIFLLFTKQ